jgi:hypothetical protein
MRDQAKGPVPEGAPARWRLVLPFGLLVLGGVALSAFWFYASTRTRAEIDSWLQREAAVGRVWSCADRAIGGFPFRIEFTCTQPSFEGETAGRHVTGRLGSALAVAQVYSPSLVIVEAQGPLEVKADDGSFVTAGWTSLRASLRGKPGAGLERLSVEAEGLDAKLGAAGLFTTSVKAADAQAHLRPVPDAKDQGTYDVALSARDASAPGTALLFGADSVDLEALATVTQANPLSGHGLPAELQRWHEAGGDVRVTRFILGRPDRRIQAQGELRLDAEHRPAGAFDISVTGLDKALAMFGLGAGRADLGGLLGALLGKPKAAEAEGQGQAQPGPKPVTMTLRLDKGRAMLGPLPLGPLRPLY